MSQKKFTKNTTPKKSIREHNSIPWRYCLLTLICGLFLVVGFFGAARQHFSSIEFGIKNSKLRQQITQLEAEQRRMLLTKEVVLSPAEIKKSAKKIGFTEMSASNIEVFRPGAEIQPKIETVKKTVDTKPLKENANTEMVKKEKSVSEKNAKKKEKPAQIKEKNEKPKTQLAKK